MPPRDPKPANSRRRPTPKLDVEEPALTAMLEKYCDLRRRGFGQQAIQTKASWPRHYPSLLLKEAQRRKMPGSQQSQQQAVTEWLLAMFDAGTELKVIQRMSAFTGHADHAAAANRPGRRQWTSPDGPHHQKPRRRADQGILARHQRGTHAPAVRRRLPGRLPRRPSRPAMYRSRLQATGLPKQFGP